MALGDGGSWRRRGRWSTSGRRTERGGGAGGEEDEDGPAMGRLRAAWGAGGCDGVRSPDPIWIGEEGESEWGEWSGGPARVPVGVGVKGRPAGPGGPAWPVSWAVWPSWPGGLFFLLVLFCLLLLYFFSFISFSILFYLI